MISKRQIRQFLKQEFLEKPKGKWDKIERLWSQAIWGGYVTLVATVGFATGYGGILFLLLCFSIVSFIIFYIFFTKR